MGEVSKRPHGYRGYQRENGRYLRGQMSARVGKGLIGIRSPRGIACYMSPSVRMAREVSREKEGHTHGADVRQSREESYWNPLAEGN